MKCNINPEDDVRCPDPVLTSIRVQVQHSDTGRITWQTWKLCGYHLVNFKKDKGKDWYTWYRGTDKRAYVIGFKEEDDLI